MKTWGEITVKDMGEMLRARGSDEEKGPLYSEWSTFIGETIKFVEGEKKNPRYLMLYFSIVCAAVCEMDQSDCQEPELDALKRNNYLDGWPDHRMDNVLKAFADDTNLKKIKDFIRDRQIKSTTSLDDVMNWLEENIKKQFPGEELQCFPDLANYLTDSQSGLIVIWNKFKLGQLPPEAKEIYSLLQNGTKQIILNGAPGTGKSYISELLANYLGTALPGEENFYTRVQFHPSYDYTDFVEGLRPVEGENDRMIYKKLDGHFKSFCRRVVKENKKNCPNKDGVDDPDRKYFFLIDEINRADLSKVFGELMFCLESDKRGEKVRTQYQNLPTYDPEAKKDLSKDKDVFADGFYIPENVYIIGTMNDIDRSVESMDFALRRRFLFKEIKVDEALLKNAFQRIFKNLDDTQRKELVNSVVALNKELEAKGKNYNLNRQYFISQGQFANLPEGRTRDLDQIKKTAWEYRIEPLLREYLRGESEDDIKKFVKDCGKAFGVEVEDSAS